MNKKYRFLSLFLILMSVGCSHSAVQNDLDSRPSVLNEVVEEVILAKQKSEVPIVIFDLDDTLFLSATRKDRILKEFADQDKIKKKYPKFSKMIFRLPHKGGAYTVAQTLKGAGIDDDVFIKLATDFWVKRFFTNEYVTPDLPVPGGVPFVNELLKKGAFIVYLTGRDEVRMKTGTRVSLLMHHYPLGENTLLILKPNQKIEDAEFKEKTFETLKSKGRVIAGFENEPLNINLMKKAFPLAKMIFLDTLRSDRPDKPEEGIVWIKNYKGE